MILKKHFRLIKRYQFSLAYKNDIAHFHRALRASFIETD